MNLHVGSYAFLITIAYSNGDYSNHSNQEKVWHAEHTFITFFELNIWLKAITFAS